MSRASSEAESTPDAAQCELIRAELERILASAAFKQSQRQQRFLKFIVEETLSGRGGRLKGYNVGVEVFERDPSFDPNTDSIVRVEAGRLRFKLREYYAGEGAASRVRIELPKGRYRPRFRFDTENHPAAREGAPAKASKLRIHALAVLPLVSLSDEPAQGFFADGMTDALINRLARNRRLSVTSFTSSMRFKGTRKTVPEIAAQLNVDCVIEGSVLRAGPRVRITAQLIDARADRHLWAESYEREMSDVLAVQDEVARSISEALGLAGVLPETHSAPALNVIAYEENLLGRRSRMQLTLPALQEAIAHFQRAIELEPGYGEAYAGMAGCYCTLGTHGVELKAPHEIIPRGIELAERAIALDETFVEGRAFLGIMLLKYRWDWPGAERQFRRALELSPSDPRALMQYSMFLESTAQHDLALAYARRARRVDPLSKPVDLNHGWQLFQAEQYAEARTALERLCRLEPDFWGGYWGLGHVFRELGELEQARDAFARAVAIQGRYNIAVESLGHVLGLTARREEVREIITRLEQAAVQTYVSPCRFAAIYAGLGEADRVFEYLGQAFTMRARSLAWLAVAKEYRAYRSDPRFGSLLQRIGIPGDAQRKENS